MSSAKQEPYRLLVVDDSPSDVFLFREALDMAEVAYELTVMDDGAAAIEFSESLKKSSDPRLPDLIVLDLNLPKMDGFEVLEALRRGVLQTVPVVVITSSAARADRERTESYGVRMHLTKPIELQQYQKLGITLRDLLEGGIVER